MKTKNIKQSLSDATGTAKTMDFWQLTSLWIEAVKDRYAGFRSNDLTQIFMRGPFAGWSERELFEFAKRMDEAQTKFPIWPNAGDDPQTPPNNQKP